MTYMATPQLKKPCPKGHDINNFGRPFLGHYYHILSLSDLCQVVEKRVLKKQSFSLQYMTYMAIPQHKKPCPGVMKFTNLVDLSSVCLIYAQEQRRRFLKKYINLTLFSPKLSPLGVQWGVMKFKNSCLLTLQMLHTKFCKDSSS